MILIPLIPLVSLIGYLVLIAISARQARRIPVVRVFLVYLVGMALWSLGSFAVRVCPYYRVWWHRLMIQGALGMAITFYHFVVAFLQVRRHKWLVAMGYAAYAVLTGLNLLGYVAHGLDVRGYRIYYEAGPAMLLSLVFGVPFLGGALYLLVRSYLGAKGAFLYRVRISYLLIGMALVLAGSATNAIASLSVYPIDIAANLVNALLIAYVILRYQLLDVALVIRKGLVYSSLTALMAGVYLFIVFIFTSIFHAINSLVPAILIASGIAVVFQPIRDRAQLLIDRFFFREKYDAQLMLQELSELVVSILDINKLTSLLLDRLTTIMHVKQACIMLKEKKNARFHLIAQKGQTELEEGIIFREDHPVVQWVASHGQLLTRHDLDVLPQFKALWVQEREDLGRIEAELFVPLLVRGELIGILILGPKLSETPYSQDEQLTLTTLANQTAVAIQNAWLYSDLEQSLEELKQMQAQLIQTEKLSAIGEMIAGVAHEINNPLTAVIGYSQLLQLQAGNLSSQVHEDVGQILEAGLRVKRIVANLLDFSRQHTPQKEYVDINQIVSTSLGLRAHDLVTSNIQVQTDLAPDLPWTMVDRHQLQQVFINIINNAQQAMAEKGGPGVLTVSTRRGRGNTILISFQDTGPGIPKEIMGRIFDPFFTTKEVGKGTGLGLSVSYGIVQEHEGRIWAESENGQGATFFIELPIRRVDQSMHRENDSTPTLVEGGRLWGGMSGSW